MIDPKDIKIQANYVLVLPDKSFETYQMNGRETGILAASYKLDEKGQTVSTEQEHISISGKVYAVPAVLNYYGNEIWHLLDKNEFRRGTRIRTRENQSQIDEYRKNSVQFAVPIEVEVGDTVYFEYLAHMFADQQSLWFDTIHGKMMLIKYDMLILSVRNEHIIPLNGFLIIENELVQKDKIRVEWAGNIDRNADEWEVEGTTTESGLVLINHQVEKKTRVSAHAKVLYKSGICQSYLDFRNKGDGGLFRYTSPHEFNWSDEDLSVGDTINYDPRFAKELEYGLHRIFSEKRLVRIQRKDVYFVVENTERLIA